MLKIRDGNPPYVSGLRELGKNWTEIAGRVGSKTSAQCKRFYRSQRQKLDLDDLIADYQASKVTYVYFTLNIFTSILIVDIAGLLTSFSTLMLLVGSFDR